MILANSKESFKMNWLEVRCCNTGTKNFAHLEVPVLRADKIGLNLGKPFINGLCILDDPYMIPGCESCR